ncbi:energy-coupling factor ABC transporter ATP-binding protein [Clostridium pasteurianum]|uniref:ABC-type spermidine/putrescine transport system, ATPase component n=1 Tax=Clostridium pasteurianum BC1 TaxID=86416 RepID=R4KF87_CLOPA|nr:ABC transporter ATP-binding protein [Clostridium pasteurianum]AGK98270.1 ABC-type spermidine/putrescine transport system, ATPase component [Clostridium pasteurianum BC1]
MEESILSMKNVIVNRKARKNVLNIDNFSMKAGEIIAVVGPNGSGKSTLFQVINLLIPCNGELKLFGESVKNSNKIKLRRRCSYVFQEMLLLKDTVFNNVAKALQFRRLSNIEINERVHRVLREFECEHLAERQSYCLSGGEAQRVCIARAMVTEPDLLLLDEPSASLDAGMKSEMIRHIKKVAEEKGIAVILVSHNFSDVLHFAERAVVMFDGKFVQDEIPEVLMRRPANEKIAKLVGIDNILSCNIDYENNSISLDNGIKFSYPYNMKKNVRNLCIPGECIKIYDSDFSTNEVSKIVLEGSIKKILPDIGSYYVIVQCEGQNINVRVSREYIIDNNIKEGKSVKITFSSFDVHII